MSRPQSDTPYELIGRDPQSWAETASSLKYSSEVLRRHLLEIMSLPPSSRRIETLGLAFENLVKSTYIKRDPNLVTRDRLDSRGWKTNGGHGLRDLATALMAIQAEKPDLLTRLEEHVVWAGRYPIPRRSSRFRDTNHPHVDCSSHRRCGRCRIRRLKSQIGNLDLVRGDLVKSTFVLALLLVSAQIASADQSSFSNSGGSTHKGSAVIINSNVTTPPGTLAIDCPITTTAGACAGGAFSYLSNDGTTSVSASFSSGTVKETCWGGGRGRPVICAYSFIGYFSGTLTVNGAGQAIVGVTSEAFGTTGGPASGTSVYNSAYTPFYFSNTGQIVRSDDLQGTNLITYGTQGNGVGQFYGAYGIGLDSAGRIYVADTYNGRVIRIDDMNGTNWTSFGTYGSDVGQFNNPMAVSVDANGEIYVMDTGNSRLIRMDDMNGTNWTTVGSVGSGVGQFTQYSVPVAFDATGRIYIGDAGRIVRMDDISGTNWTTLTFPGLSPIGVALDAAGRIFILQSYQGTVVRVDDMTGANMTSISHGPNSAAHSIAVDPSGMVLVGGGGAQIIDNMAAVLTSSSALTQYYGGYGWYYVFGATLVPLPSPRPSAISVSPAALTFAAIQDTGTSSPSRPVTISNFGGSPLNFSGISPSSQFVETDDCPGSLPAGASCTANVSFAPTVAGPASGQLMVNDDSGNLGPSQTVNLSGTASLPRHLTLSPATLNFAGGTIGDHTRQTVTVSNTGGSPVNLAGITMSGDASFVQQNTCGSTLPAGATCAVTVTFSPSAYGIFSSTLFVTESSGAQETVSVSGTSSPDN